MAFVFTPETGTGTDAAANSYASLAEANDYFEPDSRSTAWDGLTDSAKESLLAVATRTLDIFTTFKGTKTVKTSPLAWPRTNAVDKEGNAIGTTVIPVEVKRATYELARVLIGTDLNAVSDTAGLKRIQADVVEIEFLEGANGQGVTAPKIPGIINALLNGLGSFASGGRSQSAPIRRT